MKKMFYKKGRSMRSCQTCYWMGGSIDGWMDVKAVVRIA
jgi:hypothetical protein